MVSWAKLPIMLAPSAVRLQVTTVPNSPASVRSSKPVAASHTFKVPSVLLRRQGRKKRKEGEGRTMKEGNERKGKERKERKEGRKMYEDREMQEEEGGTRRR